MSGENKIQKNPMAGKGPGGRGGGPGGHMGMVEKAKDAKGTIKKLLRYLKPQMVILSVIIILAIIGTIFQIATPKVLANLVTNPLAAAIQIGAGDFNAIFVGILVIAVMYAIAAIFTYVSNYISTKMSQMIVYKMRNDVKGKLDKLPINFYDTNNTGDILSRITNDIDTIGNTLQQSIVQLITGVITVVGVLIMMFTISAYLTLIALATLPLFIIITAIIMKKSQGQFKNQQKELGEINSHTEEMYSGHKIIKLYGREEQSISEFEKINQKLCAAGTKAQFLSGIIFPLLNFVNNIGYVGICVVGAMLCSSRNPLLLGSLLAFITYTQNFSQPILQISQIFNTIQSAIAASERVFEVLEAPQDIPDKAKTLSVDNVTASVVFDNVSFSYDPSKELIKNLNLAVKEGDTIAIVGPTGAGKTTLVNLLMRFYEVGEGAIYVGGIDSTDMKREDLRSLYGMVLQDTWLFSGTVKDNIAYGKPGATDAEIIDAAKQAHVHDFIETLEHGYNTLLSEDASNISQGQKQLLTIARAILSDPKILILDEATSSVDTRTEEYIQTAMTAMMKGKTSFVIAHRLSTIKKATNIIVMNKGSIVEQGNHNELLAKQGFYADLYNAQFNNTAI